LKIHHVYCRGPAVQSLFSFFTNWIKIPNVSFLVLLIMCFRSVSAVSGRSRRSEPVLEPHVHAEGHEVAEEERQKKKISENNQESVFQIIHRPFFHHLVASPGTFLVFFSLLRERKKGE